MTRLKIEIAADDDVHAVYILDTLRRMMLKSFSERLKTGRADNRDTCHTNHLAPGYTTSDLDGSSVCTVTREPDQHEDHILLHTELYDALLFNYLRNNMVTAIPETIHFEGRKVLVDLQADPHQLEPCPSCHDTGWYGDNGPGRGGNREMQPCDHCTGAHRIARKVRNEMMEIRRKQYKTTPEA